MSNASSGRLPAPRPNPVDRSIHHVDTALRMAAKVLAERELKSCCGMKADGFARLAKISDEFGNVTGKKRAVAVGK